MLSSVIFNLQRNGCQVIDLKVIFLDFLHKLGVSNSTFYKILVSLALNGKYIEVGVSAVISKVKLFFYSFCCCMLPFFISDIYLNKVI